MSIIKRNVKVGAVSKPVISVAKPPKVSVPTKVKAEPVQVSASKKPNRIVHAVESTYNGGSKGLNTRKSATKLDLGLFNTRPDMVLTSRTELVLQSVKDKYGRATFARGNIDAGVLKYGIQKGHLQPVNGDGGEDTMLRFTPAGMGHVAGLSARRGKKAA